AARAAGAPLFGVEGVEAAIAHARDNAADVEAEFLVRRVDRARLPDSDVIILDPPRAGAGKAVTSALIGSAARTIVYASCDSATLARDLARLTAGGFATESLTGLDPFPLTARLETVTALRRCRRGDGRAGSGAAVEEDEDDDGDDRRQDSQQPPPARRSVLRLGDRIADDGEDDADEQGAEAEPGTECERVHVISSQALAWCDVIIGPGQRLRVHVISSKALAWSDDDVAAVFTVGGDGLSRPW